MFIQKTLAERFQTIVDGLKGDHVKILVDTSANGVNLPNSLADGNVVPIKISYLFQGALSVEEDKIEAELRFSGKYFHCRFPLEAIRAVSFSSGETFIFTEEPTTLSAPPQPQLQSADSPQPKTKPTLTRIK